MVGDPHHKIAETMLQNIELKGDQLYVQPPPLTFVTIELPVRIKIAGVAAAS